MNAVKEESYNTQESERGELGEVMLIACNRHKPEATYLNGHVFFNCTSSDLI